MSEVKINIPNIVKEAEQAKRNNCTLQQFFEKKKSPNLEENHPEAKERKIQLMCDISAGVDELQDISKTVNRLVQNELPKLFGPQRPKEELLPLFQFHKDNEQTIKKAYELQVKSRFFSSLCQIPELPSKIQNYIQCGNRDDILNSTKILQKLNKLFQNHTEMKTLFSEIPKQLTGIFDIAKIPLYAYNFKFESMIDSSNQLSAEDAEQLVKSVRTMIFLLNLTQFSLLNNEGDTSYPNYFEVFCSLWIRKISQFILDQSSNNLNAPISIYFKVVNVSTSLYHLVDQESSFLPEGHPQLDMNPFIQKVKDLFYSIKNNSVHGYFSTVKVDQVQNNTDDFGFSDLLRKVTYYHQIKNCIDTLNCDQIKISSQDIDHLTDITYCILYEKVRSNSIGAHAALQTLLFTVLRLIPTFSKDINSANQFIKKPFLLNSVYSKYASEICMALISNGKNDYTSKISDIFNEFKPPAKFNLECKDFINQVSETTMSWIIMKYIAPNSTLTPQISDRKIIQNLRTFAISLENPDTHDNSTTGIKNMSAWFNNISTTLISEYWTMKKKS